jgi:hypothetical protein
MSTKKYYRKKTYKKAQNKRTKPTTYKRARSKRRITKNKYGGVYIDPNYGITNPYPFVDPHD